MSTRTWDSGTVEGCLAELKHQRERFMALHEQHLREKKSLLKRAQRAEEALEKAKRLGKDTSQR